jgi:hypothetical protein
LDDFSAFSMVVVFLLRDDAPGTAPRIMSKGDDMKELTLRDPNTEQLKFYIDRATTDAEAIAAVGSTGELSVGEHHFVAATYDEANGPELFVGKINVVPAEIDVYGTQTVGAGSTVADAANSLWIGNRATGTTDRAGDLDISRCMYFSERLTLAKIRRIWHRPAAALGSTLKLWIECGYNGTGTQADWSGNGNNGTVTGAALADHAPVSVPFAFDEHQGLFVPAAAAAAASPQTIVEITHTFA